MQSGHRALYKAVPVGRVEEDEIGGRAGWQREDIDRQDGAAV